MLDIWMMSKKWHARPSDLLSLRDPFTRWCFDQSVFKFGSAFDAEIRKAEEGTGNSSMRVQMIINRWIGHEQKGAFNDPMLRMKQAT